MTTYLVLILLVLAVVVGVCLPVLRRLPPAPLLGTGAALVLLTAAFDSVIVAAGLTVYDPEKILGLAVGRAPVEDFGYTVAAVVLMPVLWTWLGRGRNASARSGALGGERQR